MVQCTLLLKGTVLKHVPAHLIYSEADIKITVAMWWLNMAAKSLRRISQNKIMNTLAM